MNVRKLDPSQFVDAYDIKAQIFYPWAEAAETPFSTAWAVVKPQSACKPHRHHDQETFLIVRGRGRMTLGHQSSEVEPGDVIYIPPFSEHTLANTSDTEDLHFVAIWWNDPAVLKHLQEERTTAQRQPAEHRLVTVSPGASEAAPACTGADLAGDLYLRYARLRGDDCEVLTVHGTAVRPPAARVARVARLFQRLVGLGSLVAREAPAPFCERCADYVAPASLVSQCLRCGTTGTGHGCRRCGWPNYAGERSVQLSCGRCGQAPALRPLVRWYLRVARHEGAIRALYEAPGMSPWLRSLVDGALEDGLLDVPLSHTGQAGPPLPVPGFGGQRLEPIFEISAAALEGGEAVRPLIAFFGVEEGFHYAVLLPALADACALELRPEPILVSCGPALATAPAAWKTVPDDLARLYLAGVHPESAEATLSLADCGRLAERELAGQWEPWLQKLEAKVIEELGGQVPGTGAWTAEQKAFMGNLLRLVTEAAAAYEPTTFSPQQAAHLMVELVRLLRRFARAEEHWRSLRSRRELRSTAVALELLGAKTLALIAAPLMPDFAARLWRWLGYGSAAMRWEEVPDWVPAGQRIVPAGEPWFPAAGLVAPAGPEAFGSTALQTLSKGVPT